MRPTRMNRTAPDLEIESVDQVDSLVLAHLRTLANSNGIAAVSKRDFAEALPLSPATASRAVARLIDAGYVELVTRGTGGRYRSRYRVRAGQSAVEAGAA